MSVTEVMEAPVTFSERAASEVKSVLAKENRPDDALRVFIAGAGCSGLQYGMGIEQTAGEDDTEFEQHGLRVIIDDQSLQYMQGASVEYIDDENGGGFRIDNPNAPAGCSSCASGGCDTR